MLEGVASAIVQTSGNISPPILFFPFLLHLQLALTRVHLHLPTAFVVRGLLSGKSKRHYHVLQVTEKEDESNNEKGNITLESM